jgi:predicted Rossmann fold flavoprotein
MNKEYDIIIIGADPAGLFAAANIKSRNKALILEKNSSAGKKLLMSGSGKCNITQDGSISDFLKHYGRADKFIAPALREFTNNDLIEYLNQRGLKTIERKGKIFPASENARDVLDLLLNECYLNGVQINYNEPVINIEKTVDSFIINTSKESYCCSKVLITTGGKSYPTTGSTGDGYNLAKSLGHTIEKPKPALAPVYIENYRFSQISGVSLEKRKITLIRENKVIHNHEGDIGFTHWGLSGPGILDMSRYIEAGDTLKINLISRNQESFRNDINTTASSDGKTSIKRFLKSYPIPENLIKIILEELKLDTATHLADINKNLRNQLIELFCGYPFVVQRTGYFNIAMATKGGVSLKEVSPKTMESRLVPNLFFAGEVLDIDGDTGGYNIQAAFSTGRLAGKWM